MAEKTAGIYKLVTIPAIYELIQNMLGGYQESRDAFFPDLQGQRVLELGCGPGTWCRYLGEYEFYMGIDWNADHIMEANRKYGSHNTVFATGDASDEELEKLQNFDCILAIGLLHHLDDNQAGSMIRSTTKLLEANGRLITLDPVYHDGQGRFSRWMKDRDSGQNIRRPEEYIALVKGSFRTVDPELRTDLLRIPYSHFAMTCTGHQANSE